MDIKFTVADYDKHRNKYVRICHKTRKIAIDTDTDYENGVLDRVKVRFELIAECGATDQVECIDLNYQEDESDKCPWGRARAYVAAKGAVTR
jgi:hypothetical protein